MRTSMNTQRKREKREKCEEEKRIFPNESHMYPHTMGRSQKMSKSEHRKKCVFYDNNESCNITSRFNFNLRLYDIPLLLRARDLVCWKQFWALHASSSTVVDEPLDVSSWKWSEKWWKFLCCSGRIKMSYMTFIPSELEWNSIAKSRLPLHFASFPTVIIIIVVLVEWKKDPWEQKAEKKVFDSFCTTAERAELSSRDCTTQMSKWDEMRNWIGWREEAWDSTRRTIKCATYFPSISAHPDCVLLESAHLIRLVYDNIDTYSCVLHDEKWEAASTWVKWWWIVCRYIMIECQTERKLEDELCAGYKDDDDDGLLCNIVNWARVAWKFNSWTFHSSLSKKLLDIHLTPNAGVIIPHFSASYRRESTSD